MFNRVILVGNLTRDIELRYLPNGNAICSTAIATNRRFKKQDGSAGEEVCFIDISLFGRTAEIANQYLKKGSKVLVEGRLKLDTWTDQSGQKKSKHSVVVDNLQMLDTKNQDRTDNSYADEEYQQQQPTQQSQTYAQNTQKQNIPEINIDEDEIPF
ncbi:MAG: single-stranded DNA-binding protein [Campylobacteraceae bacterium]|jgi:single-strand DNA-binding protein|nr:single-stranded DNA-binding protein [Campylobacteraceae bacterium]